ncbi:hypothetical protein KR018_005656, partial [Drosophila ironensis]
LLVFCVILVSGQRENCTDLERRCDSCVQRLNNESDRQMAGLNRECKEKTRRTWQWRSLHRCEFLKLNCLGMLEYIFIVSVGLLCLNLWILGRDLEMSCGDVARLAGMRRIRN